MCWSRNLLVVVGRCACGCGKGSTAHWLEQLKSPEATTRIRATQVLQERTADAAVVVPALLEALADENPYVRRNAARGLVQFGAEARAAVPALVARLRDREPSVRKAAAHSLVQIDPGGTGKAGAR